MVKYCTLCKAEAVKGSADRSFHRIPAPQYLREKWCQILGKDVNKLSSWTFVCSDHFSPDCFIYRSNGQRFLNDDAVPHPFKGKEHFRVRKKKKSKKLQANINQLIIKTECDEQELLNEYLDREIKVESIDVFQEPKEFCIKTEKSEPHEIFVKTENISVKFEPPEELDIGEEAFESSQFNDEFEDADRGIFETWELDDKAEAKSDDISETSELHKDIETHSGEIISQPVPAIDPEIIKKFSKENNGDVLPRVFKFMYPKPSDGVYLCVECSFRTNERSILRRHFLGHRDSEYKKHPELYKEYKSYQCKQCKYLTILRYNLSRHMVKHLPKDGRAVKTFVCDECEYTTKYRCDIVKHRSKHVPTGYRYFCTKCSYKVYDYNNFKEHIDKGHIENKQYKYECQHCPYKTDSKGALSRHIRDSHSGNKPFKYECKYCNFKNDSKGSLNLHMRQGHTELGLPPGSK